MLLKCFLQSVSIRQETTFVPFTKESILYLSNPLSSPVSLVMVWTNIPQSSSLARCQWENSPVHRSDHSSLLK